MPRFRKKPVVIEAVLWDGTEEGLEAVFALVPTKEDGKFDLPDDGEYLEPGIGYIPPTGELEIPTLEGRMTAQPGDWIIKGVQGELYPCKPDIFKATYDPVEPTGEPLTEREREIVDLRKTGMSYKAISEKVGLTVVTVGQLLDNAKKKQGEITSGEE